MTESEGLGVWVAMGVVTRKSGVVTRSQRPVATEVPCTVSANGVEVATVACLPADLRQWAAGFLFSSGIINAKSDLKECRVDTTRWTVDCTVSRTPDVALLGRRLYTSGCGRGVVYPDIVESILAGQTYADISLRHCRKGIPVSWEEQRRTLIAAD